MNSAGCLFDRCDIHRRFKLVDEPGIGQLEKFLRDMSRLLRYQGQGQPPFASTPADRLEVVQDRFHFIDRLFRNEGLIWDPSAQPSADYTVFIQLWDDDEQVAVFDGPPVGGDYPTGWWDAGEVIIDNHPLDLSGLPPGRYRLLIGLYRLETGERLAASGRDGNPLSNFAVEIPLAP